MISDDWHVVPSGQSNVYDWFRWALRFWCSPQSLFSSPFLAQQLVSGVIIIVGLGKVAHAGIWTRVSHTNFVNLTQSFASLMWALPPCTYSLHLRCNLPSSRHGCGVPASRGRASVTPPLTQWKEIASCISSYVRLLQQIGDQPYPTWCLLKVQRSSMFLEVPHLLIRFVFAVELVASIRMLLVASLHGAATLTCTLLCAHKLPNTCCFR